MEAAANNRVSQWFILGDKKCISQLSWCYRDFIFVSHMSSLLVDNVMSHILYVSHGRSVEQKHAARDTELVMD